MSLLTSLTTSLNNCASLGFGTVQECVHGPTVSSGESQGLVRSSIDFKVDAANAPNHYLVKVTYGMYYKPEGWSYNSYTLKLYAAANGDLHYERIEGVGKRLVSSDTRVQATPFIKFSNDFRLEFYCRTQYLDGSAATKPDRQLNPLARSQPYPFALEMKSLCLKTG